ncbi:MAG: nucleotide exchange factor GrpE [Lentisphaerae bacterium]|nr:nucleotide exchange factor GrpE [Lentisphaerota bacterium]
MTTKKKQRRRDEKKAKARSDEAPDPAVEPAPAPDAEPGGEDAAETAEPAAADVVEAPPETGTELDALNDRYLRLRADFENFRSRMQREKHGLYRRANEDIMLELLPVLDHMELALEAAEKHDADPSLIEGFRLVWEQMLAALRKFGLTPVDAEGQPFDPHLHEAISHIPSEHVPENEVVAQVRRGYKLGEKLLRPAQAAVSSGRGEMETAGSGGGGSADGAGEKE